jgi:hypothetical protein
MEITAQEFIVLEPLHLMDETSMAPLEITEEPHVHADMSPMEVSEPGVVEIVVEELPGAPEGTKDPEPVLEVAEKEPETDENDVKKKNDKWDWESKGAHGFLAWIKGKLDGVPKHSGYDSAGLERACAYLEKLDKEISRAMRLDLDGELDANKIEDIRAKIDDGVARLQGRLGKVEHAKKSKRKKKSEEIVGGMVVEGIEGVPGEEAGLVKEAQKILGVKGIMITVPAFIARLARTMINGMVSGGHDLEDMEAKLVKKWKLTDREQMELIEVLESMGYATRRDRSLGVNEDYDFSSSDNMDFAAQYRS